MAIQMFADNPTRQGRALQIYLILIGAATRRETISYGALGTMLGYKKGGSSLAQLLGPVMKWCKKNGLPALTALVVNQETGIPGQGLSTVYDDDFPAEQQRVFKHRWLSMYPPTIKDLAKL